MRVPNRWYVVVPICLAVAVFVSPLHVDAVGGMASSKPHKASVRERYLLKPQVVIDRQTGLVWTRNANMTGKRVKEKQAVDFIKKLNGRKYAGYSDWRMPSKAEFDRSFDFAVWDKQMESKNRKLARNIGIANIQSDYYHTSSAHMTAIRYNPDVPVPDRDYSTGAIRTEKLKLLRWDSGWWMDDAYLWPVAGGSK